MTLETTRARARDDTSHGILGHSAAIRDVLNHVTLVGSCRASVLRIGESGTGTELVARAIHVRGSRRAAPLIAVNCDAIPDTLLESELFGHEKGAFIGADRKRRGLVVEAGGGTLLLGEVGDLSPAALQAKFLRLLEDKRVRPVGAIRRVTVDFRLISATHFLLLNLDYRFPIWPGQDRVHLQLLADMRRVDYVENHRLPRSGLAGPGANPSFALTKQITRPWGMASIDAPRHHGSGGHEIDTQFEFKY